MKKSNNALRLFSIAFYKELWDVATSLSSMILIVGGMVAYGLLYNLLYQPNIVREAPIVVVDNSHTHLSRHLISLVDASPNAEIVAVAADISEARSVLSRGEAEAILYLPHDMDKRIGASCLFSDSQKSLFRYRIYGMRSIRQLDSFFGLQRKCRICLQGKLL